MITCKLNNFICAKSFLNPTYSIILYSTALPHIHPLTHNHLLSHWLVDHYSRALPTFSGHFIGEEVARYGQEHPNMQSDELWSSVKWWRVARRRWLTGFFATCVGCISWLRCSGFSCWSTVCGLQDSSQGLLFSQSYQLTSNRNVLYLDIGLKAKLIFRLLLLIIMSMMNLNK